MEVLFAYWVNLSLDQLPVRNTQKKKQMPFPLWEGLANIPTVPNFLDDFEIQEANTYSTLMAEVCFGKTSKETLSYSSSCSYLELIPEFEMGVTGPLLQTVCRGGLNYMQLHIIFLGLSSLFQGHFPLFPIISQPEKEIILNSQKYLSF